MKNPANIELFPSVSFLDKLLFTKHLAVMIKSGITISEAVSTLAAKTKSNTFRKVLSEVSKEIDSGQTLSRAMEKHPEVFDHFYVSLIAVGEESAELDSTLSFLAAQLTKDYELRKKIRNVMLYPMIVLVAAAVVGMSLSLFVLPKLIDLFTSLDTKLPLSTVILLFIAQAMKSYGILIFTGLFLFLILFRFVITLPHIKPLWHALLLDTPLIGPFLQNSQLASICRNIGTMLKSGLPITKALDVEHNAVTNLVYQNYIKRLQKAVDKGANIQDELGSGRYPKIPEIAVKMIGVGEKTGNLDEMFLYLGNFFEEETDDAAKTFSTVLEPVLLLIIGLIVAFVAMAIITPIYQLTGSIHK